MTMVVATRMPAQRGLSFLDRRIFPVALILLAGQLALLGWVVSRSFFKEDDFQLMVQVTAPDAGAGLLLEPHGGRFMPAVMALAWAMAKAAPYSWVLVTAVVQVLQAAASLAFLRLLTTAFGRRKAVLLPFALYLFWPLTLPALAAWTTALQTAVFHLGLALAVTSYLLLVRWGGRIHAAGTVGWSVVAGLADGSALLIPVLLLAVHALFLAEERGRAALTEAVRERPAFWALYGSATAVLAIIHLVCRLQSRPLSFPAVGDAFGFLVRVVGETFGAGLGGGPLRWHFTRPDHGVALPEPPVSLAAWILIVIVVWASISTRGRRPAVGAWIILAGFVLATAILPALLWTVPAAGVFAGQETRLVAHLTPVAALCLAAAFLPFVGEQAPDDRRPAGRTLGIAGAAAVAVVTVLSCWSASMLARGTDSGPVRAYVATAAAELAKVSSATQIYDGYVPKQVMFPWFGEDRLTSRVLAPLARPAVQDGMRSPKPAPSPVIFDESGRLRPMTVAPVVAVRAPKPGCYRSNQGVIDIPLTADLPPRTYTAAMSYISSRPALAVLSFGGRQVRLNLEKGVRLVHLQVPGGGGSVVRIGSITQGTTLCVSGLNLGSAVAVPGR
ncbi:hypothetical protein ACIBH1_03945 [Nonomuraea sp. NPDC050663]|uniref:hypothetical protein n=1 Tax=Nonomuraea sp. NPDC050663 TaxID=3364370 RepID=UPI0037A8CBFA